MIDPNQTWAEIEQEGKDAIAAGERAEEIRDTPLGEEIDGGNDWVSDQFNPISGEMD